MFGKAKSVSKGMKNLNKKYLLADVIRTIYLETKSAMDMIVSK